MSPTVGGSLAGGSAQNESAGELGRNDHVVQFYDDDRFLVGAVGEFLRDGVRAGEALLVFATREHQEALARFLGAHGNDVGQMIARGTLALFDADATLARFMVEGKPDEPLFRDVMGPAIAVAASASQHGRFRAYGEMVNLLWRAASPDAALRLEEMWNDLAQQHSFSLLCAYAMDNFRHEHDVARFADVCHAHSRVIPTESFVALVDGDSQSREVSLLQQRARVLESEIARRKQTEAALREALRVRDDFLCVAGHELRTPLTVLRLQVATMRAHSHPGREPRTDRRLSALATQTERLARLAERLLDVSQLGDAPALRLRQVNLADLVRDCVAAVADVAVAAGCPVRLLTDGNVVSRWDPDRIEQVVQDLLSNAFKFGVGTGVEVRVRGLARGAEIIVRDGGIGIPVADQERIFDRFERQAPTESFGGLGLGLWIARRVVRAHGGDIRVESRPGHGATFTVSLPYSD